jgi:hypothetical protein
MVPIIQSVQYGVQDAKQLLVSVSRKKIHLAVSIVSAGARNVKKILEIHKLEISLLVIHYSSFFYGNVSGFDLVSKIVFFY